MGGVSTLFSAPIFGKLADKHGKLKIFTLTALLTLPFVYLITNMPAIPFYFVLIATGLWFIVSNGRSIAAQSMVSNVIESQYRGSFMSLNSSFQQLFIGTASFIAGLIVPNDASGQINHYSWAGYFSIGVLLFCIYLGYVLKKKTPFVL